MDLKRLLNKKTWTGRELGIIELTQMALMAKQKGEGVENPTPLVEPGQFQAMINGLDAAQGKIYNGYISIHKWLQVYYPVADAARLRLMALKGDLVRTAEALIDLERAEQHIDSLPAIMTEKQRAELVKKNIAEYLEELDAAEPPTLFYIITLYVDFYLKQLEREPKKANPLRALKKKYSKEKAPPIDEESAAEPTEEAEERNPDRWREMVSPAILKTLEGLLDAYNDSGAFYKGGKEWLVWVLNEGFLIKAAILYSGGTEEEALQAAVDASLKKYEESKDEAAESEDEAKTKWDIAGFIAGYYPFAQIKVEKCGFKSMEAAAADFLANFPELVTAALEDLKARYKIDLTALPVSKWDDTGITHKKLYELDIYGYRENIESRKEHIYKGNHRAIQNGVAIISESQDIDEAGNYTEPPFSYSQEAPTNIYNFNTYSLRYIEETNRVEEDITGILESYYTLLGFDTALDLIADTFDLPAIAETFKLKAWAYASYIKAYNELIFYLFTMIARGRRDGRKEKLEALRDIFPPIDIDSIEIPAEKIAQAAELMKDFKAFTKREDIDSLEALLLIKDYKGA